jgi:uncharacterized membrane protein YozB (DUF420 family)
MNKKLIKDVVVNVLTAGLVVNGVILIRRNRELRKQRNIAIVRAEIMEIIYDATEQSSEEKDKTIKKLERKIKTLENPKKKEA